MISINYLEGAAAALGMLLLWIAAISRPFGAASWQLSAFAGLSGAVSGVLAVSGMAGVLSPEEGQTWAFRLLLPAACAAHGFTSSLEGTTSRLRRLLVPLAYLLSVLFCFWIRPLEVPEDDEGPFPLESVLLGPAGYLSALFLLGLSVAVLVNLEKTLRKVEEYVRWELKFVVIGVYACFAALIYLASRMLLTNYSWCYLPMDTLRVYPIVFGVATLLMLASWRRLSRHGVVIVSQQVAYGSLTLLGVGLYLVFASLASQWIGTRMEGDVEAGAAIFMLSALLLAVVLFSTRVRHRARYWVRRHFFAGRYDYRSYWREAVERVRSTDSPEVLAASLADIVLKAVDALDVTVWLRSGAKGALRRVASRGGAGVRLPLELTDAEGKLHDLKEPTLVEGVSPEVAAVLGMETLKSANAALLVPLRSGEETVGLMTVSDDKSGRAYDQEALELIRVLGSHAASEFHKMELLAAQVEAKESETFQSFATFVLHDLKNFASTLSLIAKNAARHQSNPDFQRDAFQSVLDTAEKMTHICNSLRMFTGLRDVDRAPHDLNEIIREAAKPFERSLGGRLRLDLSPIPLVNVDGAGVASVVQNLIVNATEAITHEGSVLITTRASLGQVELTVKDDGKGIPRQFLEHELFQPFKTTKSTGLGIGLFQSKKIVEAHGGSIRVESEEGLGTMVAVTFPASGEKSKETQ